MGEISMLWTINISPLRGGSGSKILCACGARQFLLSAFCLLLCAFCFQPSASATTWTRQPSGTMAWLRSVYFLDQNRGWVAGSNGTLLQTTDGGATWKKLLPLTRDTLQDVYFANERVGWLVVERDLLKLKTNDEPRSYLLKTEDGGFSWRRVFLRTPDANVRLVRAIFADSQRGWVFGETGIVFATRDGGEHWERQASPTKHLLLGGAFVDYAHVWLVGAGATIVNTNDGGLTWQNGIVRDDANARFNSASFVGNSLGWAVGAAGRIFTTIDGGRTWSPQKSNIDSDLLDVKFIDANEGWVAGNEGLLLHTNDGGAHWAVQTNASSHALQRLCFVDRDHGWAVGFGGTILKYGVAEAPRLKS
ncbi:MAG: hypothetical protein DMF72_08350 [Acidobacteria bacterium]|nr:MAG: hypothetical protein DMF72_08350 [Acidobacteriota bacterium]